MGYRHTKDDILEGALAAAFDDGLSSLSFGRVAKRLGISDRVVVYYFPTKADLVGEVIAGMGAQLQVTLASAFNEPAADHLQLLRVAWPVVTAPAADRVFALFFEANGLAAIGREPYVDIVPLLVETWISWLTDFFEGNPTDRRTEAATAIAVLDGLLLLRQLAGVESADRAAKRLGIVG